MGRGATWGILLLVCSGLLACGTQEEERDGRRVIRMAMWSSRIMRPPSDTDAERPFTLHDVVRQYEELHPDRVVDLELQPGPIYERYQRIQMIGDTAPAVMQSQWRAAWDYARVGRLLRLDEYLDQVNPYTGRVWRDQYYENAIRVGLDPRGELYILPIDQVKTGIFYNKEIFRKLGLSPPETWAEFMEISATLNAAGYIALGVDNSRPITPVVPWSTEMFVDSVLRDLVDDLDVLSPDGKVNMEEYIRGYHKGIINPDGERFRAVWRLFKEWSGYWQEGFNAASGDDLNRWFLEQKVAMLNDGVWRVRMLQQNFADLEDTDLEPFEFGVFPLPHVTPENYPYFHQPLGSVGGIGIGFVVPKNHSPETIEATVDWLQYMTNPENIQPMRAEMNLPCMKNVDLLPEYKDWEPLIDGTFPDLRIIEGLSRPDPECANKWFKDMQLYLADEITLDEMSRRYARLYDAAAARIMEQYEYDTANW